jgi:hypothetical protein
MTLRQDISADSVHLRLQVTWSDAVKGERPGRAELAHLSVPLIGNIDRFEFLRLGEPRKLQRITPIDFTDRPCFATSSTKPSCTRAPGCERFRQRRLAAGVALIPAPLAVDNRNVDRLLVHVGPNERDARLTYGPASRNAC